MDQLQQLTQQVSVLTEKIVGLEKSINTIKKIFFWMMIAAVVSFLLPLIGLVFVIPSFIENYTSVLNF